MESFLNIEIFNLKKEYEDKFTFSANNTTICGNGTTALFGCNGSGKTTFLELITGNLASSEGQVLFNGNKMNANNYKLKRLIGYLPQKSVLPPWSTCEDLISYVPTLMLKKYPSDYINQVLSYWNCDTYRNRVIKNCSHGMKKRVMLALITFHDPDYLILDEPFSGLDYSHIVRLERYIERRNQSKKLTLLGTHMLPFAARLCKDAYYVSQGILMKIDEWKDKNYSDRLRFVESALGQDIVDASIFDQNFQKL